MKRIKNLLAALFIGTTLSANAQKDSGTIKVFDNNTEKLPVHEHTKSATNEFLMKFETTQLYTGDFALFFEKQLSENFSVEVGPGITFRDLELDVTKVQPGNAFDDFLVTPLPNPPAYTATLGYSFMIDARYFPGNNMMSGVYFSPQIEYRHYGLNYTNVDVNGNPTGGYTPASTNVTSFRMVVGLETDDLLSFLDLADNSKNGSMFDTFVIDYSLGIGFKHISGTEDYVTSTDINGNPLGYTLQPFSIWRLAPYIGLRLGFNL